ncbi:MAG: T9SS type A sorting domain-containing protein [Bacteroidota bacterium]
MLNTLVLFFVFGLSTNLVSGQCALAGFGGECLDVGLSVATGTTTLDVEVLPSGTFSVPFNNWNSVTITIRWAAVGGNDPLSSISNLVNGTLDLDIQEENISATPGALSISASTGAALLSNGYFYKKFAGTIANNGLSLVNNTTYNVFSFDFTTAESSIVFEIVSGNADPYSSVVANNAGPSVQNLTETFQGFINSDNSATFNSSAFPVEWLYFNAEAVSSSAAELTWATATESNNDFFQIEKSVDGELFEVIARVQAVGNSATTQEYDYLDKDFVANKVFYRLKQVDVDGKFTYAEVVEVNFDPALNELQFDLFPNPATTEVTLKALQSMEGTYRVSIVDATGRKVWEGVYKEDATSLVMPVQRFAEGIYAVYMVGPRLGSNYLVGRFVKK